VQVGLVVDLGVKGVVVGRARVLRQAPERVDAPGGDLLLSEVVAVPNRVGQPPRDAQQQRQVAAAGEKGGEAAYDLLVQAVESIGKA
jgi:hypothetical protein